MLHLICHVTSGFFLHIRAIPSVGGPDSISIEPEMRASSCQAILGIFAALPRHHDGKYKAGFPKRLPGTHRQKVICTPQHARLVSPLRLFRFFKELVLPRTAATPYTMDLAARCFLAVDLDDNKLQVDHR